MECLLFGILPKQALNARFPSLRGTWECKGLPRAVAIDNGPEFANRHLDDAARQVDFDLLPCPVRVPWFKGIVEGFFARLNRQLLRALPGTTFANVVERGDYDPAQHACLSLAALEEILVLFCVDYYPQRFNRHLGGRQLHRFDLEHTYRFCKQTLNWTTPRVRTPQQADRWTWLVALAYTQLRLARRTIEDVHLPWEPPQRPIAAC